MFELWQLLSLSKRMLVDAINNVALRRRAKISPDCTIHHTVRFNGKTEGISIGAGVVIAENATLTCRGPRLEIREGVKINSFCIIETGGKGNIRIGANTAINSFSTLYGQGGLEIGSNVRIGPRVGVFPSNKRFADNSRPIAQQGIERLGIVIEDDVWLGANVQVMDGVVIGRGSIVGAGAVVTRSLPPYSVAAGVPARVVRSRTSDASHGAK